VHGRFDDGYGNQIPSIRVPEVGRRVINRYASIGRTSHWGCGLGIDDPIAPSSDH
jgi:hypothetical protein